jgi:hypothetical protein
MTSEITILSAKAIGALTASGFLAASDYVLATVGAPPQEGLLQYGVLGIACMGLLYGIKTLHTINQKLQEDRVTDLKDFERQRVADAKEAERQRLEDRDVFFDRLDNMLGASNNSRAELSADIKALVEKIDRNLKE